MKASSILESRLTFNSPSTVSFTQLETEACLNSFESVWDHPSHLFAMMAGGLAYKGSRMILSRVFLPLIAPNQVGVREFAKGMIRALALAGEVNVFRGIAQSESPRPSYFLSDYFGFALLKFTGHLSKSQNFAFTHLLQTHALMASSFLPHIFGIGDLPQGSWAEQYARAEVQNLSYGLAMTLMGHVSPGLLRFERQMDLQTEVLNPPRIKRSLLLESKTLLRMSALPVEAAGATNRLQDLYEEELMYLADTQTPFQELALRTIRDLDLASSAQADRQVAGVLNIYQTQRIDIAQDLIARNRAIAPQVESLFVYLRQVPVGREIVDIQWGSKDPAKIPIKLRERHWTSMEPFTDLLRGKVIVASPYAAPRVLESIQGFQEGIFRIREERGPRGDRTGRLDQEPFDRLLRGYFRGVQWFALRRMKVVWELPDLEGNLHPFELQILSRYFDRWGEIQRQLVKDNKTSSPQEWAILDTYCNEVAEWLAQLEQYHVLGLTPSFVQGAFYHSLPSHLRANIDAMEAFVEEVQLEHAL